MWRGAAKSSRAIFSKHSVVQLVARKLAKSMRIAFARRTIVKMVGRKSTYKADDPRDDLIVVVCLTVAVILIALIPYILYKAGSPPTNLGYIETLDLVLGPIIVAGSLGVYLEDRLHMKKRGG